MFGRTLNAFVVVVCLCLVMLPTSSAAPANLPVEHDAPGLALQPEGVTTERVESKSPTLYAPPSTPYVPGQVIVKLRQGATLSQNAGRAPYPNQVSLDATLSRIGVRQSARLFPNARPLSSRGAEAMGAPDMSRIYKLELDADVMEAVAALSADPSVEYAEPDYIAQAISNPSTVPLDFARDKLRTSFELRISNLKPTARNSQSTIPNDPLFAQQWGLAKVNVPDAWDVVTGTPTVVIAVVDSGLDADHPDLAGQLWVNPGEVPGNGLDDDANGCVDDVNGCNVLVDSANIDDSVGHGTQVAGIIAAATNNGEGIAGMCWNCRLMTVKVMAGSTANYSDIAEGIIYAADKGAEVINLSVGGYSDSSALRDAIDYAISTGAVVVGGAGNDNVSTPFYPAAYGNVLAVAGTLQDDTKWGDSNYGTWVDVSAPAANMTTTLAGGDYGPVDGTSYATPLVSGLAALVRSQHPDWSEAMVRAQVLHTTDPIDAQNPAYAGRLGSGRINAEQSVTQAPHPILEIASTAVNGDPLGRPTPGATATLAVVLGNNWQDATDVVGVLSTSDVSATITSDTASFGVIAAGAQASGSPVYSLTITSSAGYNHAIPFTLNVSANSGAYTATFPFTLTTQSSNQNVGGSILSDATWTRDKTYIVNSNVGIASGVTLTIQPGTVVKFNGDYNLNVYGTLIANGAETQPIRFMSNTDSSWGRIYFDDTAVDAGSSMTGTYQGGNILRHVRIEDAASGIACNSATPYLEDVTSDGGGINCTAGSTLVWLMNSDLRGDVSFIAGNDTPNFWGRWAARTSMPTRRASLGVTVASNGKIYAIGGNNGNLLATVEEYDSAMDTWVTRASMPTPREWLGVTTASNGKVYAIGGAGSTTEEYNPTTNTWVTRAPMPTPRERLGVTVANNGKIYAIGGAGGATTTEEYDPATNTWATRASMPTPRHGLGVVAASNGMIYAIGGQDGSGELATVEEYDPVADTWKSCASMPTPRHALGVVATSNAKIYAIGGWSTADGGYLATVEEYDLATGTWTSRATMPTPRWALGTAIAINEKIYAIGGSNDSGYLANLEEFTLPIESTVYYVQQTIIRNGNLSLPDASQVLTSTIDGSITAGSGSTIQNTIASGGITINGGGTIANSIANGTISLSGGTAQNNTISSNINIGSGSVLTNTITGGGISAGDGSTVAGNSVENAPGWGISASSSVTITSNRVVGCASGISTQGPLVNLNLIANNSGTSLEINGNTTIVSNTFTGNGGNAIKLVSATTTQINGNNLEGNKGQYDIESLILYSTVPTIPADGNWWGTSDTDLIDQRIYDRYDEPSISEVPYTPLAATPRQDAPPYVRAVTLTPASPVGIETVTFDVLFSREMESEPLPKLGFWADIAPTGNLLAGVYDTPGVAFGVAVSGTYAYVADNYSLRVADIFNPAHPTEVGYYNMTEEVFSVAVFGNYAYVTEGYSGLHVVDISNPAYPTEVGYCNTLGFANSVAISDSYAYIAGEHSGLHVVNISDPAHPTKVGHYDTPDNAYGVALSGRYAYVASYTGGLRVVDISNPTHPTEIGYYDTPGYAWGIAVSGDYAYVADSGSGLRVVNVSNPTRPVEVGYWDTPGVARGVAVSDNYAYIVDGSGLRMVNIFNPTHPVEVNYYDTPGGARGVAISGHYAYVADDNSGLGIYHAHTWIDETIVDNPQWLAPHLYRATYDINALIPRYTYTLTVSGATSARWFPGTLPSPRPAGGMEIAPNSDYTFTVDYAGAVADTTAPPAPDVLACGAASTDRLSARWAVADPDSAITLYRYAIGTTPGGTDVVNWTSTSLTSTTRVSLSLTAGQTYYIAARARNEGGLWSEPGISPGVVAGSGECPQAGFSASPTAGLAPLTVQFADESSGNLTSRQWDLGDGSSSTAIGPTHVYTQPGTYTVTLNVSGPSGSDQVRRSAYIFVTPLTITISSVSPGISYLLSDNCSRLYVQQIGTLQAVTVSFVYTHPTANYNGLPRRYDITPNPNAAGFVATLSLCYDDADLALAGIAPEDEGRLRLYRYDAGSTQWISYTSWVYTATNVVTASVSGFSTWAIGAPAEGQYPTVVALRSVRLEGSLPWLGMAGVGLLCAGLWRARRVHWRRRKL